MLLLFILVYVFPILKWKTLIYCFKALPYLREQLYLWMISIKAVNKVQYQWGKYCMINICSLDGLWMSLPFFPLFILWLLIDVCHTVFITVKYVFFVILGMLDKGLRIFFFVPCSRQGGKEKNLLFLYHAKKLQSFLSKFCNICMENLVLHQLTISL